MRYQTLLKWGLHQMHRREGDGANGAGAADADADELPLPPALEGFGYRLLKVSFCP